MFDQAFPKQHHWVCSALLNDRRSNATFYNSPGNQVNTLLLLLSINRTDKESTDHAAKCYLINDNMLIY